MNFYLSDNFQKWCWMELIGFDNTASDYGVSDFLQRTGFLPTGVSLLLTWVGFVFAHKGLEKETVLSPYECSYSGHASCPERTRQEWTNYQLRGLIDTLHKHGVKVYLSFFNISGSVSKGIRDSFHERHPEVCEKNQKSTVNMLKRLKDGSYYEDIFQEKAVKTLVDYGFDGIQLADGLSSPRLTLMASIDRDDMLQQFTENTGVEVPEDIEPTTYILENCYTEWVYFHANRWERFYEKFYKRLSDAGKEAMFNNAWTSGPFDALYRYGVDYRPLPKKGATCCMAEDVSAGVPILSEEDNLYLMTDEERRRVQYQFVAKLMLLRACMPGASVCPLTNIHDTNEQWSVLDHMPTAMIRVAATNMNTYIYEGKDTKPIIKGPFYCLCDSLRASEWDFIRRAWNSAYTEDAYATAGVTLVWSDERLDKEIKSFYQERRTPTTQILSELLYASAPVNAVVRMEQLLQMPKPMGMYSGALLVTNPDLLASHELTQIIESDRVIFAICPVANLPKDFYVMVREKNSFGDMVLAVKGVLPDEEIVVENPAEYCFDSKKDREALNGIWTHSLSHRPYSNEFWIACADVIANLSGAPVMKKEVITEFGIRRRVCKYICVQSQDVNKCRVILFNDDYWYNLPKIDLKRKIRKAICLTKYPEYQVSVTDTVLSTRVACRGAEIIDVEFEPED